MEDARKNVNVFELDKNASNQDYLEKLAELNIFLNERELENYKAAFREHDEDGSGNISTEELCAVMKKLGDNPTENELLDLVNKFDEDGNGTIEFAEFLVMMTVKAREKEIEEAEHFIPCCFRVMRDTNGRTLKDSTISVDHLRFVMQSLPREVNMTRREMNKMVDEIATIYGDKDGQIRFEQFVRLMKK